MSDIHIRRRHQLPIERAREAAEDVARQLEKDFDLRFEWRGPVLHFERSGVEGDLRLSLHEIRIDAQLGLLLSFLKTRIESEIKKQLDRLFGRPAEPTTKKLAEPATKKPAATKKVAAKKSKR